MNIEVSAFVSYYNGTKYLETFLKNFEEQTFFENMEMVFVGCLCSEQDKETLLRFKEKHPNNMRIEFLDSLETQSACWNIGIKLARADLVCEWNVDDLRTPDSVERQWRFFEAHPEVGVVTGNFIVSEKFTKLEGEFIDHSFYTMDYWQRGMLLGPFFMFRKSLCAKVGYFDEQLRSGSDFDFSVRLLANTKLGYTNYLLGYFLDEGQGLSTGGNILQPVERTVVEKRYGFTDKVDHRYSVAADRYDIENLHQPLGKIVPALDYIPNSIEFIEKKGLIHS